MVAVLKFGNIRFWRDLWVPHLVKAVSFSKKTCFYFPSKKNALPQIPFPMGKNNFFKIRKDINVLYIVFFKKKCFAKK